MNEHINFFKNLPKHIQTNFVFRVLKERDEFFKTCYIDRIKANFKDVVLDYCEIKLIEVLNKYKLALIAYNSTTCLQTLSINFPTVMFWNDCYFEPNETSKKYFDQLKDAKILHSNHLSASDHINSIWNNIDSWWESDKVQYARKFFCDKYAKQKKYKNIELKKFIKDI